MLMDFIRTINGATDGHEVHTMNIRHHQIKTV